MHILSVFCHVYICIFFPIRWLWQSSPGAKTGGLSWDFDVNCKDHRDTPQQFTTLWHFNKITPLTILDSQSCWALKSVSTLSWPLDTLLALCHFTTFDTSAAQSKRKHVWHVQVLQARISKHFSVPYCDNDQAKTKRCTNTFNDARASTAIQKEYKRIRKRKEIN